MDGTQRMFEVQIKRQSKIFAQEESLTTRYAEAKRLRKFLNAICNVLTTEDFSMRQIACIEQAIDATYWTKEFSNSVDQTKDLIEQMKAEKKQDFIPEKIAFYSNAIQTLISLSPLQEDEYECCRIGYYKKNLDEKDLFRMHANKITHLATYTTNSHNTSRDTSHVSNSNSHNTSRDVSHQNSHNVTGDSAVTTKNINSNNITTNLLYFGVILAVFKTVVEPVFFKVDNPFKEFFGYLGNKITGIFKK